MNTLSLYPANLMKDMSVVNKEKLMYHRTLILKYDAHWKMTIKRYRKSHSKHAKNVTGFN